CTSTATSVRLRITDARSVTIGREYRELNDFRSLTRACLRLSRACLSLRSLHSRPASFSRERGSPGGIARTASRARSLRPKTSTTCPAARAWNPPSRTSSKDFIGDASASNRRALNPDADQFTPPSRNPLRADYRQSVAQKDLKIPRLAAAWSGTWGSNHHAICRYSAPICRRSFQTRRHTTR